MPESALDFCNNPSLLGRGDEDCGEAVPPFKKETINQETKKLLEHHYRKIFPSNVFIESVIFKYKKHYIGEELFSCDASDSLAKSSNILLFGKFGDIERLCPTNR